MGQQKSSRKQCKHRSHLSLRNRLEAVRRTHHPRDSDADGFTGMYEIKTIC